VSYPKTAYIVYTLLALFAVGLIVAGAALAWPTSSYRGHDCGYYNVNGVNYAMCYAHQHSVSVNECSSHHLHHYQGWKQIPSGDYVRMTGHDHHLCAPSH